MFIQFILFLCFCNFKSLSGSHLGWNRLHRLQLAGNRTLRVPTPGGVPSDTAFLEAKAFAYAGDHRLLLSTDSAFAANATAAGREVALVAMDTGQRYWYLRALPAKRLPGDAGQLEAWILFEAKSWHEPLPGGCDLVSPVPNSPLVAASLSPRGVDIRLRFSLAAYFSRHSKVSCQVSADSGRLQYRLYAYKLYGYTASDWLAAVRRLAQSESAVAYGQLVARDASPKRPPVVAVAERRGLPLGYALVVERLDTHGFSSYAPLFVGDSCGGRAAAGDATAAAGCAAAADVEWRAFTTGLALLGLFLCLVGFRYFALSVFACGCVAGSLLSLPLLLRWSSLPDWLDLLLGVGVCGLACGCVCAALWLRCRSTPIAFAVVHLPAAYALCCFAFATPLGGLWWLRRAESWFFIAFGVVLLLLLLVLLFFSHLGAILSLSLLGTFLTVLCVSANLAAGSSLPYVFLDVFRRTAYANYNSVAMPLWLTDTNDAILLGAWFCGTVACCLVQYCWNRRQLDPSRRGLASFEESASGGSQFLNVNAASAVEWPATIDAERTPLLQQQRWQGGRSAA